jgi:hypothetical protein
MDSTSLYAQYREKKIPNMYRGGMGIGPATVPQSAPVPTPAASVMVMATVEVQMMESATWWMK